VDDQLDPLEDPQEFEVPYEVIHMGGLMYKCYHPCGSCSIIKYLRCIANHLEDRAITMPQKPERDDVQPNEQNSIRKFDQDTILNFLTTPGQIFHLMDVGRYVWVFETGWMWDTLPIYNLDLDKVDAITGEVDTEEDLPLDSIDIPDEDFLS